MTAPPFPYFGSKQTLASRIVQLLPTHEHYVEPYAGSLAVLLAKPQSVMETVNDIDGDLMNFWQVLREHPTELIRVCALTPHSRQEHQNSYDRTNCDPIERARRVWVALTQGRSGQLKRTGWRHYIDPAGSSASMPRYLQGYVDRMARIAQRLQRVSLESRPALELIDAFTAQPKACLYVDPPYLGSTRVSGGYIHEMRTDESHCELAAALLVSRASVVLSGYASDLYNDLYDGWYRYEMLASTGQGVTWANRTEVLWSNRPLGNQPALWDDLDKWHPDPHEPDLRNECTTRHEQ